MLFDPQWLGFRSLNRIEWGLICAGASLAISVVVLLIVYQIAGQQTAEEIEPLQQGMADVQACLEIWSKLATADLQRAEQEYRSRYAAVVERRDKSLQQFTAARDERIGQLEAQRNAELHEAARRRDAALHQASERHNSDLLAAQAAHRSAALARRTRFDQERARLARSHEQKLAEQNVLQQELADRSQAGWLAARERFARAVAALGDESRRLFPGWETLAGPAWQPAEEIPTGLKIGDYQLRLGDLCGTTPGERLAAEDAVYALPAVLPFPRTPSLLLKAGGAGREQAVAILQVAMLRLLTQLPPGDVRFTIFDPVGLGENFAAFMHLADYDDLLISHRIWTEAEHIEQQLANLTEHMENVFQKYLRNEFESIEDYNERAGEVAEPYRILIVANFPAGFSERAAQRLASIAASGARCGVFTLASVDMRQPLPGGFDLSQLDGLATVLDWREGRFRNDALGRESIPLAIDPPPPAALFASLIRRVGEVSKDVRRVEVPFHRIVPREEAYWTGDSRGAIDVPLGRAGATKLQHLRLGQGTSQHVLVAGKTGSGKSTLLHVIVTDLALRYSPDEIEFYLIDFKKGVEFKTYAAHRLPHARVIAIESDREFGTSVLERLDAILKERGDLFRREGVQDIKSFRDARPDVRMPRILLIVDEFQEFFVEDDRYSQSASLLLDRLVRQGRAFGIHILLGSQTLGGAYSLARTTIGQMAVRIALQCSETDAHLILSEENSAARLLTRPGEAIYNDANGLLEGNNPFQVAWLDDDQRDGFLDRIGQLVAERGTRWPEPIVFEGNIPADPSRNDELCELVESAAKGPAEGADGSAPPRAWLGEAVAITGPASVVFSRRSGANLLIVGQDADAALGILATSLIALTSQATRAAGSQAANGAAGSAAVPDSLPAMTPPPHAADAQAPAADAGRGLSAFYLFAEDSESAIRRRWSGTLDLVPGQVRLVGSAGAGAVVAEIAADVVRRRDERQAAPPVFVLIDDISRFRELRKSDDDFGFGGFDREKTVSPGQLFAAVLRDGPAVGVHVIVWCDSYNNVERWFSRQLLREFEMRVVFQMSAGDSSNLIDLPAASRLGTNRAILYSDERGTSEKFRPYGPPSQEWLDWLRHKLRAASAEALDVADDIDQWVVT